MLLTSGIVLGWKNYHFKVTRGENKRPFEWYLGAGVCITVASIASFIVIKRADSPLVKKCSLVVRFFFFFNNINDELAVQMRLINLCHTYKLVILW